MIKTIVQKTINNIIKENYRKEISIQFSLDGFSFCICNSETKELQHFTTHTFENSVTTPELLVSKIEELLINLKSCNKILKPLP